MLRLTMSLSPQGSATAVILLTALALAGCVKQVETKEPAPAPAAPEPFAAAPAAPSQPPSVAGIPSAAIAAAGRAVAKVEVASTNTLDHGTLYRQAQALFAEKKYAEALRALDAIQVELLTPAQAQAVTALRTQITAAQGATP
jgi:hypothetical protein